MVSHPIFMTSQMNELAVNYHNRDRNETKTWNLYANVPHSNPKCKDHQINWETSILKYVFYTISFFVHGIGDSS